MKKLVVCLMAAYWACPSQAQTPSSEFVLALSGFNEVLVVDPEGYRTGRNPAAGYTLYNEDEGAIYYLEGGSLDPDVPGDIKIFRRGLGPHPGVYQVMAHGTQLTWSRLWVRLGWSGTYFVSAQDSLETTEYRITYDPVQPDTLFVEKVVTFESARRELAAMRKLDWFSEALFTEFDGRFAQAQVEADHDPTAAQTTLEALDRRIDAVENQLGGNLGPGFERSSHTILKENVQILLRDLRTVAGGHE
jgi:hypothetical protein